MSNKLEKPIYWKHVLITIGAVYPLIIGADHLLRLLFPMHKLPIEIGVFFTVIIVAALMVNPVMPFAMKIFGKWLHK